MAMDDLRLVVRARWLSDSKDVFFFRLLASSLHRRKRARTVIVQHHKIREVGWGKKKLVYLDASAQQF